VALRSDILETFNAQRPTSNAQSVNANSTPL
jgi:hypothetical protein